jgi:hypothetical protein
VCIRARPARLLSMRLLLALLTAVAPLGCRANAIRPAPATACDIPPTFARVPLRFGHDSLRTDTGGLVHGRTLHVREVPQPVGMVRVQAVTLDGRAVAATASDSAGWFTLGPPVPRGRYLLRSRRIGLAARRDTIDVPLPVDAFLVLSLDDAPPHTTCVVTPARAAARRGAT